MGRNLLHVAVVLQEGTADVQRKIGAVDHPLEQHQEFGDNFLYIIRDEDLAGEELDLAFVGAEVVLQLREEKDSFQIEGIIHVQMDPEQGILKVHENPMVEFLIVLILAVLRLAEPEGIGIVDLFRLRQLCNLFRFGSSVLVLFISDRNFLLHRLGVGVLQEDGVSHEPAVPLQDLPGFPDLQELLFLLGDMQNDIRAVGGSRAGRDFKIHPVRGNPVHRLRAFLAGKGFDFHPVGDHEDRIEAQPEMPDDVALLLRVVPLELLHEFGGAGKGDLIDVLLDFFRRHADPGIRNADGLLFLIHGHLDLHLLPGVRVQHAELRDRVAGIRNRFPQENILIGVQPALNDRHDILRVNGDAAVFFLNRHGSSTS